MKKFELLKGGIIKEIIGLEENSESVIFHIETNLNDVKRIIIVNFNHHQDCCESFMLEEYHGNIQVGDVIREISIREESAESEWGSATWSFLVIETQMNSITLRFCGESNGYYSESCDVDFTGIPEGLFEVEGKIYASFDGIVTESTSHRKIGTITIAESLDRWNHKMYVVSNGRKHAHGETLEQALNDLRFKNEIRDLGDYKHLTFDDELNYDEAIMIYRQITGACSGGVQDFLKRNYNLKRNRLYKIREIIELTKGQYGSEIFIRFFNK